MKFNIMGKKIEVTDKIKDYATKKLSKLDKFFKEEPEARVVVGKIKEKEYLEATIKASGMMYRAEITDNDVLAAIDKSVDIIERQIRKNKTKLEKKIKKEAIVDPTLLSGSSFAPTEEDEQEFKIVKRKRFQVKPMTAEEAILQMNLLGHTFFVFINSETDEMNVVYKRKDGNYSIIESME